MPYKDPVVRKQKQAEYARKYYETHGPRMRARTKANKKLTRSWWTEFKATLVCWYCGETAPECIDLHHVITSGKKHKNDSASSWIRDNMAREKVMKLIEETCVPLCSNCHRKVHAMHRRILREQQDNVKRDNDQTV